MIEQEVLAAPHVACMHTSDAACLYRSFVQSILLVRLEDESDDVGRFRL